MRHSEGGGARHRIALCKFISRGAGSRMRPSTRRIVAIRPVDPCGGVIQVYDIAWGGVGVFASVSADGSVRVFDLRDKEHSTIIYESPHPDTPLLRLGWNKQVRAWGQRWREWTWWAHTGGGNALAFKQPT